MTNQKDLNKDTSCEARIKDSFKSREEDLEKIFDKLNNGFDDEDYDYDDPWDELNQYMLGYSTYKIVKIELSTGGPADWIEVKLGDYKEEIISVTYHFADWFDHAEMKVDKDTYLYQYVEQLMEAILS